LNEEVNALEEVDESVAFCRDIFHCL